MLASHTGVVRSPVFLLLANHADRVKTLCCGGDEVLSELSELGSRFEKDLSKGVTLGNVLDLIRCSAPA